MQHLRSFLGWVAVTWMVSAETTARDPTDVKKPQSAQPHLKQAVSQLRCGASDAKILDAAPAYKSNVTWNGHKGEFQTHPTLWGLKHLGAKGAMKEQLSTKSVCDGIYTVDECSPCANASPCYPGGATRTAMKEDVASCIRYCELQTTVNTAEWPIEEVVRTARWLFKRHVL